MKQSNSKIKFLRKSIFSKMTLLILVFAISQKSYAQTWSDVGGGFCYWAFASVVYNGELIVGKHLKNDCKSLIYIYTGNS